MTKKERKSKKDRKPKTITVSCMNLTISPHPYGVYEDFILKNVNNEVHAFGEERAQIVNASKRQMHKKKWALCGYLLVYTELIKGGAWFDVQAREVISGEEAENIQLPENYRPNVKSFRFVFDLERHELFYERINDKDQKLPPKKLKKILENMAETEGVRREFPDVSVTVMPTKDALEKVLAVPNLKKLEIRLERPNADDIEDHKHRLMRRLEAMGARKEDIILTKAKGAMALVPDEETKILARVGSISGYVRAIGKTLAGMLVDRKTTDYPYEETVELDGSDPFEIIFGLIDNEALE
ncbi:MAG TPA: DUF4747 family protein [Hyphomicrobium sp.]|nr:DUF4747 family protein [Hyphomicrobium sp.]